MTVTGVRRAGERAAVLEVDGEPALVAAGIRALAAGAGWSLDDVVPGATTVCVSAPDAATLTRLVAGLPQLLVTGPGHAPDVAVIEVPVRYDGPDLDAVAAATGLTVEAVAQAHSQPTYRAAFTGFAPGFAYLTGLDPTLHLPRRSNPRPRVPPGSVAIAATYTAIYPRASPGGWQLIGSTEAVIFDPDREPPALIAPGALVRFRPV